jgi:hypothetical protein
MEQLSDRRFNPDQISSGLTQAIAWFAALGLQSKPRDRLNAALNTARRFERIVRGYAATGQMPAEAPPSVQALVEALEFYLIHEAFGCGSVVDDVLKQKLAQTLSGPKSPLLENQRNSVGRNIMFELALAAEWKTKNMSMEMGEPDISLNLDKSTFLVECKRPLSEHSVRANIKDAAQQLATKLASQDDLRSFGIIAISLTRLINPGNIASVAPTEVRRAAVDAEIIALRRSHPEWRKIGFHPNVAALLFHSRMPWLGKGLIDYLSVSQYVTAGSETRGYEILKKYLSNTAVDFPKLPF